MVRAAEARAREIAERQILKEVGGCVGRLVKDVERNVLREEKAAAKVAQKAAKEAARHALVVRQRSMAAMQRQQLHEAQQRFGRAPGMMGRPMVTPGVSVSIPRVQAYMGDGTAGPPGMPGFFPGAAAPPGYAPALRAQGLAGAARRRAPTSRCTGWIMASAAAGLLLPSAGSLAAMAPPRQGAPPPPMPLRAAAAAASRAVARRRRRVGGAAAVPAGRAAAAVARAADPEV